jgi:hypothetical protein
MMVRDIVFPPGNSNVLQLESRRVDFSSQFNERINRNLDINATEIFTNEPSRYILNKGHYPCIVIGAILALTFLFELSGIEVSAQF